MSALLLLHAVGCAAVFRSNSETIHVSSNPEGADVRMNGKVIGKTPMDIEITRDNERSLMTVSKPGYKEQRTDIQKPASTGWFVWDLATCVIPITLCIPLAADALSGKWSDVEPGPYAYTLAKDETGVPAAPVAPAPAPAPVAPAPAPGASTPAQ